jgi:molybdopterin converting factor subunit 1
MDTVRVLYFAWLRERAGVGAADMALPPEVTNVGELMRHIGAGNAALAEVFATTRLVRAAVNQEFASPTTQVSAGDEVAFFPPVTGG